MKIINQNASFAGLLLVASAAGAYLLYLSGSLAIDLGVPLGILLSSSGFYLIAPHTRLGAYRRAIPFLAAAVMLEWAFISNGWINAVYDSPFGALLTDLTSRSAVLILNFGGIGAVRSGGLITLPAGSKLPQILVAQACSGTETSLLFVGVFALMLLDVGRTVPRRKVLTIFLIGALGTYLVNVIRVPLIIYLGYLYGYGAIEGFTHEFGGALFFLAFVAVFWWLSLRWLAPGRGVASVARVR
jgi:exosortase/archaeosortase family protein